MAESSQTTMDVLDLIKDDHDEMRSLLKELKQADGSKKRKVLETIQKEFIIHGDAEEEVVYPAYKKCVQDRETRVNVSESIDEHRVAKQTMEEMLDLKAGSVEFDGKMKLLEEQIEHHAKDEEDNMFPEMRESCPEDELRSLARRFEDAKKK